MTKPTGYTPTPTKLQFERDGSLKLWMESHAKLGGWNPETKTFTAFTLSEDFDDGETNYVLDSLAAAVEAGVLEQDSFIDVAFGKDGLTNFVPMLEAYDESEFWVNERFAQAFMYLGFYEGQCRTFSSIAEALVE